MKTIRIYTDGACSNNQEATNVGGWGAVLYYQAHTKTLKGGAVNTTNNIMELTAVIMGLKALKDHKIPVEIYSDSAYVVNCFKEGWYQKWRLNGWMTASKKPVENLDLWKELISLVESFEQITFYKVKGHVSLKNDNDLLKWFNKYQSDYPKGTTLEDFRVHLENNHLADALANEGVNEARASNAG